MKNILKAGLFATMLGVVSTVNSFAGYVYVGSWDLANLDGNYNNPANPYLWYNNPTVYSGVTAAAHLFGGVAGDYAISTIDNTVANINHLTFLDGWSDTQYLYNPQSETFSLDSGDPGYNDPAGLGTAYSALVTDHAPFENRSFINYAFRMDRNNVPDTGWTIGLLGFVMSGLVAIRRKLKIA